MGTTSTSDTWTGAQCTIHRTVNVVLWLLLGSAVVWPLRHRVVTYAGSSATLIHFCSLGAIKMLVVLQSMRACTHCNSPPPSLIKISYIIWDGTGLAMPQKSWLDMWALSSPKSPMTSKWSNAVVCCPSSSSMYALPTSVNPNPPHQTSSMGQNAERG